MTLPYKSYYTPFFDTDFVSGIGGGLVLSFGVRGMLAFPKSPFVLVIFNILIYFIIIYIVFKLLYKKKAFYFFFYKK